MRTKDNKGKRQLIFVPVAFLAVLAVFGVYALLASKGPKTEPEKEGLAYVSEEEGRNPREVMERIDAAKNPSQPSEISPTEPGTVPDVEPTEPETLPVPQDDYEIPADLKAEMDSLSVKTLTDEDRAYYKQLLSDTVVIGDSMAQAVLENGLLDANHVFYKRGASIRDLTDTIDKAMATLPKNVIFFTGLNDTDRIPDTEEYAAVYREKIQYVLSIDPNVRVYVCTMTPPSDALAASRPDLARSPLFDAELKKLETTTPARYIDLNWMVKQQLYLADQIHMNAAFYSVWIRYVAKILKK